MNVVRKWKRFAIAFDVHGQEQDKDAVRSFLKFCDHWQPSERCLGGDVWDFAALRKGASEEERRQSIIDDYAKGCQFIGDFNPTKQVLGNHCMRVWDWAKSGNGVVADLAGKWRQEIIDDAEKRNCPLAEYSKRSYLPIGTTRHCFAHGAACGIGAARKTAAVFAATGPVFFGHGHQIQYYRAETLRPHFAAMGGCLCKLDHDYNRGQFGTLAQENGWIYGAYAGEDLVWWQAQRSGNKYILPTGIEVL